ncbi:diaminobutyrate--2-oxoglutarate transaminase [Paraburkholderia caribensis]|uniref:diaminobutyrate--2-oxoglutarate transaminase n=1 Tax=Paraburkholderia caribensis TaxID=75105 RepID=UPI00078D69F5|nr:diaminobutyrate--2-oxoglutarate transaminase [Paraburkholderia caribensis]AMV41759.1 diaminobutyrate--2-oxoglutarate transaminase [Paraburkholderia caribensis]
MATIDLMKSKSDFETIEKMESQVRSYSRGFPAVFHKAKDSYIYDTSGKPYLDFLSGAGSLNYGHNNSFIVESAISYLKDGGVLQGLDLATSAKIEFLNDFNRIVLEPIHQQFRVQFTGPTGTNAVESAIKLARKVTGRRSIAAFTNAFHGVSLGALALTGNGFKRRAAQVSLNDVTRLPFDGYFGTGFETLAYARQLFNDPSSGIEVPAAFIVETVQGEGGLNVARNEWLQELASLARSLDSLLIVDDIQAGCGRTGSFLSYQRSGIYPDIVCLSKSISGIGLPMALMLIKPEYDQWAPGEHNGTFRGNNLAFVTAKAALTFWEDHKFSTHVSDLATQIAYELDNMISEFPNLLKRRKGLGLFQGIEFAEPSLSLKTREELFSKGMIAESSGARGEVLKVMPALTITKELLEAGLLKIRQTLARL